MTNADLIIEVSGKAYRVTFARPLTVDERRRIEAVSFVGVVSTLADVRKVAETALAIPVVNIQEVNGSSGPLRGGPR